MELSNTHAIPQYADRTSWVRLFGVLELLIGLFMALFGALLVLFSPSPESLAHGQGVMILVTYTGMGAYQMLAAAGVFGLRRWAHRLMTANAIVGLLLGIMTVGVVLLVMPGARQMADQAGKAEWVWIFQLVRLTMISLVAALGITVPGVLLWFHLLPSVTATFQRHDRTADWTAECPLSVLLMVVLYGLAGLNCLGGLGYRSLTLGTLTLSGWPLRLTVVLAGLLLFIFVIGLLKRAAWAWWGTLSFCVLVVLATWLALRAVDRNALAEHLSGIDPMVRVKLEGFFPYFGWTLLLSLVATVIYKLAVWRHFKRQS